MLQQTLTRPSGFKKYISTCFARPELCPAVARSCPTCCQLHLQSDAGRFGKVYTLHWQCRVPVLRCPASPAVVSPLVMPPLLVSFPLLVGFLVRFPLLVTRPAVAGGLRAASQAHEQVGDVSTLPKFLISSFRVKTCSVQVFMDLIHRANLWR